LRMTLDECVNGGAHSFLQALREATQKPRPLA
jgi:hypothetical protein